MNMIKKAAAMGSKFRNKAVAATVALFATSFAAAQQTIDVAPAVSQIAEGETAFLAIFGALLALVALGLVLKWVIGMASNR